MKWKDCKFQNCNNDLSHPENSHGQSIPSSGDSSSKPQKFRKERINIRFPKCLVLCPRLLPWEGQSQYQGGTFKSPSCVFRNPLIAQGECHQTWVTTTALVELQVRWDETEQGSRCFSKRSSTQYWENILAVKIQRLGNNSDSPVQSKLTREWRISEIWDHGDGKCILLWSGTHHHVSPMAKVSNNAIHY